VLHQIPPVPVQVLEYRNGTIGLFGRRPYKPDSSGAQAFVIPPEIVRLEEQKDSATALIANEGGLFPVRSPRQKQRRAWAVAGRRNEHPALVLLRYWGVFNQLEPELFSVEAYCFIVVMNYQGNVRNVLTQTISPCAECRDPRLSLNSPTNTWAVT